jgi:hypothetical protein
MKRKHPSLSERASELLKDEERLSKRVSELVDEYISTLRAPGVPRGLLVNCEFARYQGRIIEILTHIQDRAR